MHDQSNCSTCVEFDRLIETLSIDSWGMLQAIPHEWKHESVAGAKRVTNHLRLTAPVDFENLDCNVAVLAIVAIQILDAKGWSVGRISLHLKINRSTVQQYASLSVLPRHPVEVPCMGAYAEYRVHFDQYLSGMNVCLSLLSLLAAVELQSSADACDRLADTVLHWYQCYLGRPKPIRGKWDSIMNSLAAKDARLPCLANAPITPDFPGIPDDPAELIEMSKLIAEVEALELSSPEKEILKALSELGAFDEPSRAKPAILAKKAMGDTNTDGIKRACQRLANLGLVDSSVGRRAGRWLSEKGLVWAVSSLLEER